LTKEKSNKRFWDRYAKLYDWEIKRLSGKAYQKMYEYMSEVLTKKMVVLEVATGTGLIATNIACYVSQIEAIDFSAKMIEVAQKKGTNSNVKFSVEDATQLSFEDETFDAVIIANALHIMPNPQLVLTNIKRVLKPNGILIAPSYSHGHLKERSWNFSVSLLKFIGFETYGKWTPEEYVNFINENGFIVTNWKLLPAAFPLVYLEAKKR